jgi:Zn-dependent protease with chaperone function/type II secretory pathway pseudopilin PulG
MNAVTTDSLALDDLVYPRERLLGALTLALGILLWVILIVGTFGIALVMLGAGAVAYLFVHSALIARLKGNGVEITSAQFPDLHAQLTECCRRLNIESLPRAFILNGNGVLNAFATQFLRTEYVVLMSDVVDAMHGNAQGMRFYIGHELGHLRMKHISKQLLRWPVLWLPLLGAAYSRARESTCDRHGLACCDSGDAAARALGALSAGALRSRSLDLTSYAQQTRDSHGFWMSFHELISGYPWLTKRAARVMGSDSIPRRNPFAYLLAIFVPFGGRLGGGFSFLIAVYIVGVLAAVAIPAYQAYTVRTQLSAVVIESDAARARLAEYYLSNHRIPDSLEAAGVEPRLADGSALSLDTNRMLLTVTTKRGALVFVPSKAQGQIVWTCANGEGLKPTELPLSCRQAHPAGTR